MNNLIALSDMERMAAAAAQSRMFGFKNKDEALAIMLLCQAEGLHPGIAMRDYHVIQGRPTLKADAMLARFQQAGGSVKWITLTDEAVSGEFTHPQGGSATITWTIEAAKKIGLTGKDSWAKYPRAMLRARVVSEGVRTVYPGAVVGVYTPEEAQDMTPPKGAVAEIEPPTIDAEPVGEFPIMIPGQDRPWSRVTTAELWVQEVNDLVGKIRNSDKMDNLLREAKLTALEAANQHIIEALPEELRNGLML